MTDCNFVLTATRPDPDLSNIEINYTLGDTAQLIIETNPKKPFENVCRERWFQALGQPEYTPQGTALLGETNGDGVLERNDTLPVSETSLLGHYIDRYYLCACQLPAQDDWLQYSISS